MIISHDNGVDLLAFEDLESRFGHESACAILRSLEQLEGIHEAHVSKLSFEERMENVLTQMNENMRYQTRH